MIVAGAKKRGLRVPVDIVLNIVLVTVVLLVVISFRFPLLSQGVYSTAYKYDLGHVQRGAPVTHTFSLVNLHPWPLVITEIATSCGCTRALSSRSLPVKLWPLQFVRLTVSVKTDLKPKGPFTHQAVVYIKNEPTPSIYYVGGTVD